MRTCVCRSDEEWTRLLKEGPGENARLFVDYFLVRLPAKEAVRRFAHEGLRLSTPRAVGCFSFLARPATLRYPSTKAQLGARATEGVL